MLRVLFLAALLTACCPAPQLDSQAKEMVFKAEVMAVTANSVTLLAEGDTIRVATSRFTQGLSKGKNVYVKGVYQNGQLELSHLQIL